jgi:hypothetical protein
MSIKHNVVFVKNKLVTIDTILPVLIELKDDYNFSSEIIVFDEEAHNAINENIVIKDAIEYVGKEVFITKGIKNKIYRRIYLIKGLSLIIIKAIFGANLFHFGALDQYPLKILGIFFRKNVYVFSVSAYNFKQSKYLKIYRDNNYNSRYFSKVGDNCVSFGGRYDFCNGVKFKFDLTSSRTRKTWIDYIKERSSSYLKESHTNIKLENGCFTIMMSSLDGFSPRFKDPNNDQLRLFIETINVLVMYSDAIPILIKPHSYTNVNLLKKLIHNKNNVYITYLHPTLLAMHSRAFIVSSFSNTLADAHAFGIDTIEYTNYSDDLLSATCGESVDQQFVTYFINNDYDKFKEVISGIASCDYVPSTYGGAIDDNSKFLDYITRK